MPKSLSDTKLNIGDRCPTCSAPVRVGDDGKGNPTYQSRAVEWIAEAIRELEDLRKRVSE